MRIAFVNRYFHPDLSGAAQMLTQLAEDIDARGQEVTVITGRTTHMPGTICLPKRSMHKSIHVIRVSSTNLGSGRSWTRLIDYGTFYLAALWATLRLRGEESLIVLSDPPLLSVMAVIVGSLKKMKTYCWLQDVYPEIALRAKVLPEGFIANLLRAISRWSLGRIGQVVVLGRCMQDYLANSGVHGAKMTLIPNWADGTQIYPVKPNENEFLDQHGLKGRFVVMYSGNHGTVHEFSTIVDMIRRTQSFPDICFCFVGNGPQKSYLTETIRQEGWENVLFMPYQSSERLRFSLSAADVHLVSLRPEMAGLSVPSKIYGIMAAGRPMIYVGPDQSEAAMVVREARCGYVVNPGDGNAAVAAVLAFYHDRQELERQGNEARKYFERYCNRTIVSERFWQILSAR